MTCDAVWVSEHSAMQCCWRDESDTAAFAADLANALRADDLVAIDGPMGAGKTTLVRHCVAAIGGDADQVSSPSYDLVHRYDGGSVTVWHVDAWRLSGDEDWQALGLDDCAQGDVVLVEWAERIPHLSQAATWRLVIQPAGGDERQVTVSVPAGVEFEPARMHSDRQPPPEVEGS